MNKTKFKIKKIISFMCVIAMSVTMLPLNILAETNTSALSIPQIKSGSVFTVTSKKSNKILEVPGGNLNKGAVLQQWGDANTDNQKWIFEKVDDQYFKITNKLTGKVADVKDIATTNGTKVHQWDYVGGDNQLWKLEVCEDGYYKIKSKQTGKCLDIVGVSSNNGSQIQIWDDVNSDNQKWKITEVNSDPQIDLSYTTITSKQSKKVMEVPGGNINNGAILQQWDDASSNNQKWSFEKVDDIYYKIINKATNKVIDVKDAATKNGTRVHQWSYVGADNQLWSLEDCGDSYYKIKSKQSGKCLDIVEISNKNGAQIQIWDDINGDNQKWKINLEPSIELILYAYGEYNSQTNSININWESNQPKGKFDVLTSTDGNTYSELTSLVDATTYNYAMVGTPEKIYFKVKQTVAFNKTIESYPFIMSKINNGYEMQYIDTDKDGITDVYENALGTDPLKADTDGDGLNDCQEMTLTDTNPLKKDTDGNGIMDGSDDQDSDGLINLREIELGTDPLIKDTDKDGLEDNAEVKTYQTNPLKADTDDDTILDGDEIKLGLNPLLVDSDGNGILDKDEKIQQNYTYSVENEDSAVRGFHIDFKATGCVDSTTDAQSVMNKGVLSSDVVGLIGEPFDITTSSTFDQATLTFQVDKTKLGQTKFEDLSILWYDEEHKIFKLMDTTLDHDNSTVSIITTHFSKYMVVDKVKWFEAWRVNMNYSGDPSDSVYYNTVLAIDCSGSMAWNDPFSNYTYQYEYAPGQYQPTTRFTCQRILAVENYITTMKENDKSAIYKFSGIPSLLCDMTSNKLDLTNSLSAIDSKGGTEFNDTIYKGIDKLNGQTDNNKKIIILLSDGEASINASTLITAKHSKIVIYTIGVGSSSGDATLQQIAEQTSGEFFKAKTGDQLIDIYQQIGVTKDFDLTDTDGDGLADVFETAGMRLSNGKVIYTDPLKPDSDNDGLIDGVEISPAYQFMSSEASGIPKEVLKYTAGLYFEMKSDPNKFNLTEALIYQSARPKGKDENGNIAPNMTVNDYSKEQLKNINLLFGKQTDSTTDALFINFKMLARACSMGEMQNVVLDMVNHFKDGKGIDYKNNVLTTTASEHRTTKEYTTLVKNQVIKQLKVYNGDLASLKFDELTKDKNYFYRGMQRNARYPYYNTLTDTMNGLTFAVGDTWGNYIEVKDYINNDETFKGTLHFTIYDHFGLDIEDVDSNGYLSGFRSWFTLQHYNMLNGVYKPFVTVIEIDIPFEGTL